MSNSEFKPLTREQRDALSPAERQAYDRAHADQVSAAIAEQFKVLREGVTKRAAQIFDTLTKGPQRLVDRALDALENKFHGPQGPA